MRRANQPNKFFKKKNNFKNAKSIFLIVILILLILLLYIQKQRMNEFYIKPLRTVFYQFKAWASNSKQNIKADIKKTKKLLASQSEPPPIHFEFYTTLPAMEIKVAKREDSAARHQVALMHATEIERAFEAELEQKLIKTEKNYD